MFRSRNWNSNALIQNSDALSFLSASVSSDYSNLAGFSEGIRTPSVATNRRRSCQLVLPTLVLTARLETGSVFVSQLDCQANAGPRPFLISEIHQLLRHTPLSSFKPCQLLSFFLSSSISISLIAWLTSRYLKNTVVAAWYSESIIAILMCWYDDIYGVPNF